MRLLQNLLDKGSRGLLVEHDVWQIVSFYEQVTDATGKLQFKDFGRALSDSAVVSLSDQAWPSVCDWEGEGQPDILVCVEWSVYPFYTHTAIEMQQRPQFTLTQKTYSISGTLTKGSTPLSGVTITADGHSPTTAAVCTR